MIFGSSFWDISAVSSLMKVFPRNIQLTNHIFLPSYQLTYTSSKIPFAILKLFLKIKCILFKHWLCNKASFILWCENHMNKASMDFFHIKSSAQIFGRSRIFKIFFCAPYIFFIFAGWSRDQNPLVDWWKDFLHLSRWALGPTRPVFCTQHTIDFDYNPERTIS